MAWIVDGDLDKEITAIREHWERLTGKSISKKDLIKKLLYDNPSTRNVLETGGIKINKKYDRLPKI